MVLDLMDLVMSADAQPGTREKVVAYLALCGFRLALVAVFFLLAWVSTWVPMVTAGIIAGLLAIVVLTTAVYEVFISHEDRAPLSFMIISSLLIAAAIVLPLWGMAQFWPAVISTLVMSAFLIIFRKRIVSSGKRT